MASRSISPSKRHRTAPEGDRVAGCDNVGDMGDREDGRDPGEETSEAGGWKERELRTMPSDEVSKNIVDVT